MLHLCGLTTFCDCIASIAFDSIALTSDKNSTLSLSTSSGCISHSFFANSFLITCAKSLHVVCTTWIELNHILAGPGSNSRSVCDFLYRCLSNVSPF